MNRQPVFDASGKVVAVIVAGSLTKTVSGSLHFLRSPRAIALDAGAAQAAEAQGVTQIAVTDRETGEVYRATIGELRQHGWQFNRGWGTQIAMRLERWQRAGDQVQIEPPAAERPQVAARQLALFGGGG